MDSAEDESSSFADERNVEVTLNLNEEHKSTHEDIETVFQSNFAHLNMKLPLAVPTALQELVVITSAGAAGAGPFPTPGGSEPKRLCIEQDGHTFILALQDGLEGFPNIVEIPSKGFSAIDTSQLLNLQELPKDGINQNWFTSREEKTTLHNKGHLWKQGMWSKEEIELLENNIQVYCKDHDIANPATIVFEMSKDERKDFYRTVAKGLNRPLFAVYRRVIRMYDNKNHVGKYTSEELTKLKKLRAVYGNDWQAIGAAMGRSASSIKDRCRLMKDNCNQGKWLPAEERRLAEAVYELTNALPGEMISSGLSWAVVAERVGTRSEKQCRTKWLNYLNWKVAGGTEWTREDDLTLICRVYGLNVMDENQVDWNELSKDWLSVRSPQWLRGKWWSLKRHVPNVITASFQEVCEYLYQHFVLKMKEEPSTQDTEDFSALNPVLTLTNAVPVVHTVEVLPPNPQTFLLAQQPIIIQTLPPPPVPCEERSETSLASTQVPSPPVYQHQDLDENESSVVIDNEKSTHLISSDPMLSENMEKMEDQ